MVSNKNHNQLIKIASRDIEKSKSVCLIQITWKMTNNICRLCFDEKPTLIDIFTSKDIQFDIVNALCVHFQDKVQI